MCFFAKRCCKHTFLRKKGVPKNFAPTYFSYKKSRQKNFPPTTPLYFGEAFEVLRNFSRKVSCVRVWGDAPTFNAHTQKARRRRAFLQNPEYFPKIIDKI